MRATCRPGSRRRRLAVLSATLLSGCSGAQSPLNPAGPQAGRIFQLWWLNFGVCLAVYLVVMMLLVGGLVGDGRRKRPGAVLSPPADKERRLAATVGFGVVLTTVALFVLLLGDFVTGRALHSLTEHAPLSIEVTGHQWWWEVRYQDQTPSLGFTTANEIHIPVGRIVRIGLSSSDVIHSFWVPNLHGKRDMIPGHPASVFLLADRPGTYRGQCAEFCGHQHAFMRFVVVAEPEPQFARWQEAQRRAAAEPNTESTRRGREVFLGSTCVMCHTIRGTQAGSRVGPDLTHVGSRSMIAGILPNRRGHLAGWIVDPQRIKPGVRMPMNPVRPADLDALVDYLTSLK